MIAIICPVINNWDYTKQALDSIKTKYPYQVLIVDQDSNDQTISGVQSLNLNYIRKSPRVSLAAAWNEGIIWAKQKQADYIFIINNDVVFHTQAIDFLIEAMGYNSPVMVSCNNIAPIMDVHTLRTTIILPELKEEDKKIPSNWREQGIDFSAFMIKPSTIDQVGYFDENYYPAYKEDWDYHTRIQRLGLYGKRILSSLFYHFGSVTARTTGTSSNTTSQVHLSKWGSLDHDYIMEGGGYRMPYNDDRFTPRTWKGSEKYEA